MSGIPLAAQPQPMRSPAPKDWIPSTTSAAAVRATAWVSVRS